MQSFGAIIYFAFFLSDWFIAHSNIPKGLNTPYAQVRLHGHFEKPGLWGFCYSAPDRTGAHLQTAAFPLFPARHTISFISPQSTVEAGPQVQQDACRTQGQAHCSCTICRDEHLQPPCASLTTWYNFTPPTQSSLPTSNHKNYGQWKQTELGKDAGILTSVYLLSYHSLKLLSNSI